MTDTTLKLSSRIWPRIHWDIPNKLKFGHACTVVSLTHRLKVFIRHNRFSWSKITKYVFFYLQWDKGLERKYHGLILSFDFHCVGQQSRLGCLLVKSKGNYSLAGIYPKLYRIKIRDWFSSEALRAACGCLWEILWYRFSARKETCAHENGWNISFYHITRLASPSQYHRKL